MRIFNIKYPILCCLLICFQLSCTKEKQEDKSEQISNDEKSDIPVLMKRSTSLGLETEAQNIEKKYQEYITKLKANPKDHKTRLNLAALFMNEARVTGEHPYYYPAALTTLSKTLEDKQLNKDTKFRALSLQASVYLSLHQFNKAIKIAQRAVAINPYNANIYGALVDANVELGNYQEAVAMADKMIAIRPDMRSYSRVSYLREIHGDVKGSIEAMQMAVKSSYPGYEATAWARYTLGNIYETYGQLEQAKMHYTIAMDDRENYAFALDGLARLDIINKEYKKAEEKINQAIKILPEVSFYESLAKVYQLTDRKDEAVKIANEVISMIAEDEDSGHKMDMEKSKVYLHLLSDTDKALESALIEFSQRPENIDVNLLLTEIYILKGNIEKATKHCTIAAKTNSKKPSLLLCQSILEKNNGDINKAKKLFDEALVLNPNLEGALYSLAK